MQVEKTISLDFNRANFEELYFKDNQQNLFLSPLVRQELVTLVIVLSFLITSVIYSLVTDRNAWLIVVFTIFTLLLFIPYYLKAKQVFTWRKDVIRMLDKYEKIKSHKLVLTEEALCLIQDETEEIHRWSAFNHVEISDNYLLLTGTAQFFFPKKSMQMDDYAYFIQTVKAHIKNGL